MSQRRSRPHGPGRACRHLGAVVLPTCRRQGTVKLAGLVSRWRTLQGPVRAMTTSGSAGLSRLPSGIRWASSHFPWSSRGFREEAHGAEPSTLPGTVRALEASAAQLLLCTQKTPSPRGRRGPSNRATGFAESVKEPVGLKEAERINERATENCTTVKKEPESCQGKDYMARGARSKAGEMLVGREGASRQVL